MNRKATLAVVALLLVGAVAVAIVISRGEEDQKRNEVSREASAKAGGGSGGTATSPREEAKRSAREARQKRQADLVERYGESRTNLSRHVSDNVVLLLEDAISIGETMMSGEMGQRWGGGRMMVRGALRRTGIELTEEQQEQAAALYSEFQQREMQNAKDAVGGLKNNPAALMELFLAGDARKREEMSEAEFDEIRRSAGEELTNVINPLDRNNFRGGRPLEDEAFQTGFRAILDDEQATAFDESLAKQETEERGGGGDISNIPTMELETLDQAVGSAQQMASGVRQLMEGMGSLQQLRPQIEPENDGEGGE